MALPIPLAAPVMRATLPSRLAMACAPQGRRGDCRPHTGAGHRPLHVPTKIAGVHLWTPAKSRRLVGEVSVGGEACVEVAVKPLRRFALDARRRDPLAVAAPQSGEVVAD